MVWNVCRRVLRHDQDAEDAFQAVFLTLARKARAIRRSEAVTGWLYRVAYRVAVEARQRARKRSQHESAAAEPPAVQPAGEPAWADLRPILDEELSRLPERLRLPIVLCYLEGKSNAEAARQIGCPAGTIFSRLWRGRELLRARLVRRGLGLSSSGLALLLGQNALAVPATPILVAAAARSALLFAAGKAAAVSSHVTTLAEGVLKAMFLKKIKVAVLLVLMVGFLSAGGAVTHHVLSADSQPPDKGRADNPPPAAKPVEAPVPAAVAKTSDPKPIQVRVIKPTPGGPERLLQFAGVLRAREQVEVLSPAAGFLKELNVDVSSKVRRGQVLAEIDAPLTALEVKQAEVVLRHADVGVFAAEAQLATTQAELQAAQKRINLQKSEIEAAKVQLVFREMTLRRSEKLLESKSINDSLLEEHKEKWKAAQVKLAAAEAGLESVKAEVEVKKTHVVGSEAAVKSAQAQVALARIGLEKAQVHLGFTRITAPFDGVIGRVNYSNGAYVRGVEQGSRPLFTIMRTDIIRVVVDVSEQDLRHLKTGTAVEISIPALPELKLKGKVGPIAFDVDEKLRTVRAEVFLPNDKNLLRPGMSGVANLFVKGSPKSLTLPESCLVPVQNPTGQSPGSGSYSVWVVRDGKAFVKDVRTGISRQGEMEVVSGLNPDDLVISNPRDALRKQAVGDNVGIPVEVLKDR